jgi:hypothetical protein
MTFNTDWNSLDSETRSEFSKRTFTISVRIVLHPLLVVEAPACSITSSGTAETNLGSEEKNKVSKRTYIFLLMTLVTLIVVRMRAYTAGLVALAVAIVIARPLYEIRGGMSVHAVVGLSLLEMVVDRHVRVTRGESCKSLSR